jgi:AcrR family transcriptional regulator
VSAQAGAVRHGAVRARILAAAGRLFYTDGIAATGIDAITAEAGVAKMSLYNNFGSKAALVEAYLLDRHQEWLALYEARLETAAGARDRVLAVFDAYLDHARGADESGFRGCGQLNAAAELPVDHPGRAAVRRHKEDVEAILRRELSELTDPLRAPELAEHLSFLLEGATARAGLEGSDVRLNRARRIASTMLDTTGEA